ncbi:hypothetical protein [Paracoccus shandongensis]|uniref:hypothetical protein n=1 Tax=Paracoccus shandongensis TaxID=2816048 RepID=UPI001A902FEB|nr:hypothetical protein [Paracoccus shandongensis]
MSRILAFILAGTLIGLFAGLSMGVAAGGTAYNAAIIFAPLGGFIGWLVGSRYHASVPDHAVPKPDESVEKTISDQPQPVMNDKKVENALVSLITSGLAITAALWNFHVDLLDAVGLLPTFIKSPWLFAALCIVISIFFPPFLVVYFVAYIGALHHGMNEETSYRAVIS